MTADIGLAGADTRAPEELHAAFMAAFADYLVGPFEVPIAQWANFLERQGVDLSLSRVAIVDGRIAAFAFAAPRARSRRWRLAGMGALPGARGTGAAPALLDDFVARGQAAGLAAVELECFERNERAIRLYRSRGFEVLHPLNGWSLAAQAWAAECAAVPVRETSRMQAMDWLDDIEGRIPDLPLQATAASLRGSPRPLQAWQAGEAQVVFSLAGEAADAPVIVHSLIDPEPSQSGAVALARALPARWPGRTINVPALQRDDLGGEALGRSGYVRAPFNQVLMVRSVRSG